MKRNGKIDCLRFIFALFIMFLHFGYRPVFKVASFDMKLGEQGDFGVNFFFIVSGYLLASSVNRLRKEKDYNYAKNTAVFMLNKYKYYMEWYLPAFALCLLLKIMERGVIKSVFDLICSMQNILLLGSLGFSSGSDSIGIYVGASWYISSLFIVQVFIVPLMLYDYERWRYILAPIILMLSLAIMVNGHSDRILRALAPITLGTICYEVVRAIEKIYISKLLVLLMCVLEVCIWMVCFLFMSSDAGSDMRWGLTILVAMGVVLSFCPQTSWAFFNKSLFNFLGKVSFPLYLLHPQILNWSEYILNTWKINLVDYIKYPVLYLISIIVSIMAYGLMSMFHKSITRRRGE